MIPLRLSQELTYQLDEARENERLAKALASAPIFLSLYKDEDAVDVLELWQQLSSKSFDPEQYYRASLNRLRSIDSALLPDALSEIEGLFHIRGNWDICIELLRELLTWSNRKNDKHRSMKADRGLAVIAWHQGDYALSHKHLSNWRSEAEILNDERNVALALGVMGLVYNEEGKKSEAMDCNERYLSMSESRGDKRGISTAIGNIGSVYWSLGQDDEAMECYKKQLAIAESIGDKSTMGIAVGNIGLVHHAQGRYDEAIECYQRKLELSDSIGDKLGVSFAIGNLGLLYFDQGHHSKAIVHHEHKLRIAESLGDKRGMSRATGNIGYVYFERLQFEDALISFQAAIEGHTAMGYRNELPLWHLGISLALLELGSMEADRPDYVIEHLSEHTKEEWRSAAYFAARENAEEGIRISRELSRFDTAFSGKIILTRIDAAEGKPELATQKLSDMLNQTNDEAEKAELHYWLWKIDGGKSSAEEAYRSYATLFERTPKFEYRKRIAELKGERIPKSADDIVPT